MTPGAHLLAGWILAEHAVAIPRARRLVVLAAILPDLDGLGVLWDLVWGTDLYGAWHHRLAHGVVFGTILVLGSAWRAGSARLRVAGAVAASFLLHLVADMAGSRGPDGDTWPLQVLWPFLTDGGWSWEGQWRLNGWENGLILAALGVWCAVLAHQRRRTLLSLLSPRLDDTFFGWFGRTRT